MCTQRDAGLIISEEGLITAVTTPPIVMSHRPKSHASRMLWATPREKNRVKEKKGGSSPLQFEVAID